MNKRTQVVSDQLKGPERQIVDGIIKITFDYFLYKGVRMRPRQRFDSMQRQKFPPNSNGPICTNEPTFY